MPYVFQNISTVHVTKFKRLSKQFFLNSYPAKLQSKFIRCTQQRKIKTNPNLNNCVFHMRAIFGVHKARIFVLIQQAIFTLIGFIPSSLITLHHIGIFRWWRIFGIYKATKGGKFRKKLCCTSTIHIHTCNTFARNLTPAFHFKLKSSFRQQKIINNFSKYKSHLRSLQRIAQININID